MADERSLKEAVKRGFGENAENLTIDQLWAIVRIAKHVRKFARNNSAFNNLFNRLFPNAQFRTVAKEWNGKIYDGLQITLKGETQEENQQEE